MCEVARAGRPSRRSPARWASDSRSGELERLRSHAAYCKPCRKAMQGWRPGAFGLALALEQAPPPKALAAPPVFGAAGIALAASSAAGVGWLARTLQPAGRALRSRWAAYVVAAACLALAAGVVLREDTVRRFVLFESVGPAVQLVRAPDAGAAGLGSSRDGAQTSTRSSSSVTRTAIAQTGSQPQQTAATAGVPAATGNEASPATGGTGGDASPAPATRPVDQDTRRRHDRRRDAERERHARGSRRLRRASVGRRHRRREQRRGLREAAQGDSPDARARRDG